MEGTNHADLRNLCRRTRRTYPEVCPIFNDERQYVPEDGQKWLTLEGLAQEGQETLFKENEPRLVGIQTQPKVGIGQTTQLVATPEGSLLWDPVGYVDDNAVKAVLDRGPVLAIAASHPHMFGVQVEWSHRLGGVPVLVAYPDRQWVGAMIRTSNTGPAVRLSPKG